MPKEMHQPSPEEIQKAQDSMTDREKILSNIREKVISKHENEGVSSELLNKCQLTYSLERTPIENELLSKVAGTIDGHKVLLIDEGGKYSGSVDDNRLDEGVAEELYKKYEGVAKAQNRISDELDLQERSLDIDDENVKNKAVINHLLNL